jgi:hypothetical protein
MSLQRVTGVEERACREGIICSLVVFFRFVYPLVAGAMVTARETVWGENNFLLLVSRCCPTALVRARIEHTWDNV